MPASTYMPEVEVSIAFDSGHLTPAASRTWTDVTAYVEASSLARISMGRAVEYSGTQPSKLTLTLDNRDGRFTPEYASGAYYPNVKKGRPIRVRVRWPITTGPWYAIFTGYVDEWPVEWPGGTQAYSAVTLTAMSRMARLARGAELRSIVEEEILYDGPKLYFPLAEPSGATTAGNIAPGRTDVLTATQRGSGGSAAFGAGTGPGTDDLTAPVFAPVDTNNGVELRGNLISPVTQAGDHHLEVECFFVAPAGAGPVGTQVLASLSDGATGGLSLALDTTGGTNNVLGIFTYNGTTIATATGPSVRDGAVHHAYVQLTIADAGTATVSVTIDGTTYSAAPVSYPLVSGGVAYFPSWQLLEVGCGANFGMYAGTIAHVALYSQTTTALSAARFTQHRLAGTTGFSGESSDARIMRYARFAGIPSAEVSAGTGLSTSIAHTDTTGQTPLQMMQDVAETEDGVLLDAGDGTLTFYPRSARYGATPAFTLSVTAGDIEAGYTPKLDDQHLVNDMTVSRPNGIKLRSANAASITEYGTYRETLEILTTSDLEVQSRADWEVYRFGTPRVTVPSVEVDLISCSSSLITSLLSATVGTKFTVTGLPSQAPASTQDFFIEGITYEIGPGSFRLSFITSRAEYANVFTLDDPVLGVLDAGNVLAY